MKLYSVYDKEFNNFGIVLNGYHYEELFKKLEKTQIPESGIVYVASDDALESCDTAKEMEIRGFGGYPVQLGYVNGVNRTMNCLEYHKSSEYNIAMNDVVLVLGQEKDIVDGKFDTSHCMAFLLPAGCGVELFGTTLHYAPFNVCDDGYRVICVLPKGTNGEKIDFECKNAEDKMCFGINKWLMAHKDAPEVGSGAYIGITGENITYNMLGE